MRDFTEAVYMAIRDALSRVEPSRFSINNKGDRIEVLPTNPHSAQLHFDVTEEVVYLSVGRGSVFEIPKQGKRYTDQEMPNELKALCEGVAVNGFIEEVQSVQGRILSGVGKITLLSGKVASEAWMRINFDLFRKKRKEIFRYLPYQ